LAASFIEQVDAKKGQITADFKFLSITDDSGSKTIEKKDLQDWAGKNVRINYAMKFEIPKKEKGPFYVYKIIYVENRDLPADKQIMVYKVGGQEKTSEKVETMATLSFLLQPGKYKVTAVLSAYDLSNVKRNKEVLSFIQGGLKSKEDYQKFFQSLQPNEKLGFDTWDFEIKKNQES
jgi:hypothetical protein